MTYARSAEQPIVWLALTEAGGAYGEAENAVRAELQRGGAAEIVAKPWKELLDSSPPPRFIVAIGVGAFRGMAESGVKAPLLAALIPRSAYVRAIAESGAKPASAVWLDQPAPRQLEVLRTALPERHRVGVLVGPESRLAEAELLRAAGERSLELLPVRVDNAGQLAMALQRTLEDADVLLALPDPQIYNGSTIQNILTSAYRRRVPLVGFSPAYVRAGALLAIYSTPAQVGAQVGEIVRGVLAGRPLPPPQGPRDFTIGVNADVARSLGIAIDANAAEKWAEQIRAKERSP